jgi:hypothetical protein
LERHLDEEARLFGHAVTLGNEGVRPAISLPSSGGHRVSQAVRAKARDPNSGGAHRSCGITEDHGISKTIQGVHVADTAQDRDMVTFTPFEEGNAAGWEEPGQNLKWAVNPG